MSHIRGMEEYYRRLMEMQDKLRRSEEDRLSLEIKFNRMLQITHEEERAHKRRLKHQYKQYVENERLRKERNARILRLIERIEDRAAVLAAKSDRFNFLRSQYQLSLNKIVDCKERPIPRRIKQVKQKSSQTYQILENYLTPQPTQQFNHVSSDYMENVRGKEMKNAENVFKTNYPNYKGDEYYSGSFENSNYPTYLNSLEFDDESTLPQARDKPTVRFWQQDEESSGTAEEKGDIESIEKSSSRNATKKKNSSDSWESVDVNNREINGNVPIENETLHKEAIDPKEKLIETIPNSNEFNERIVEIDSANDASQKSDLQQEENVALTELEKRIDDSAKVYKDEGEVPIIDESVVATSHIKSPEEVNEGIVEQSFKESAQIQQDLMADSETNQQNNQYAQEKNENVSIREEIDYNQYNKNEDQPIAEETEKYQQNDAEPVAIYAENSEYNHANQPTVQYDEEQIQQYEPSYEQMQDYKNQQYEENNQLIQQQYDESGQPIQEYADQQYSATEYNQSAPVINEYLQYDEQGHPVYQQNLQYDANGQLIAGYDPNLQYDETGQPIVDYGVNLQYDENGQIIQGYDENGQPIPYEGTTDYGETVDQYGNYEETRQDYENPLGHEDDAQDVTAGDQIEILSETQVGTEKKSNVLDMLDTDTESSKQDTKITNESDFDFSTK